MLRSWRSVLALGCPLGKRSHFGAESDVDVLVEFDPEHIPGLEFVRIKEELSRLLGRPVDLRPPCKPEPLLPGSGLARGRADLCGGVIPG
ncbi:MAG: nucleotidyltransferase family protein [Thermoanaerobaculia bacterium]